MKYFGVEVERGESCEHEGFFFQEGLNSLQSAPASRNAQLASQGLKDFFSKASQSVTKLKEECNTEKEFNCIVTIEVLIPLSSGCCIINKKAPDIKAKS